MFGSKKFEGKYKRSKVQKKNRKKEEKLKENKNKVKRDILFLFVTSNQLILFILTH